MNPTNVHKMPWLFKDDCPTGLIFFRPSPTEPCCLEPQEARPCISAPRDFPLGKTNWYRTKLWIINGMVLGFLNIIYALCWDFLKWDGQNYGVSIHITKVGWSDGFMQMEWWPTIHHWKSVMPWLTTDSLTNELLSFKQDRSTYVYV